MPDISLEMRNWAAREDVIFVEYAMEATVNGSRLAWDGINRAHPGGRRGEATCSVRWRRWRRAAP